jgi:hypothetical protein
LVSQFKFEFQTSGDISDTRIGSLLGVQFAAKDAVGFNADNHISGAAIDGYIVTRRQLMRRRLWNLQIRILRVVKTKQKKPQKPQKNKKIDELNKIIRLERNRGSNASFR